MTNNKGKMSLVIVIIFAFLGLSIIRAAIHDAIYLGQYEDLSFIPVGLMFGLPPLMIYMSEQKHKHLSDKDQDTEKSKTILYVFIAFHLFALFLVFSNPDLNSTSRAIVIGYIVIAVGIALYSLNNIKNHPEKYNKIFYKNYDTGETKTIDMYDESGSLKSSNELLSEIRGEDSIDNTPTDDEWTSSFDETPKRHNYSAQELQNLSKKISSIITIIGGVIWIIIVSWIFYLPRFFEDTVPTTYRINGVMVSKNEFYSNPIGFIFIAFGLIPIITGIITFKRSNKNN